MGGSGSTRWGNHPTRRTLDPLLWLDVRELARRGALTPGRWSTTAWTLRGTVTDWIAHRAEPDALILNYTTTGVTKSDGIDVVERIQIERTPCHYGGNRPWFLCPGCGCRRAILYCAGDSFRCRSCHNLAYGSTREKAWVRKQRRAAQLRRKIGAKPGLHHRARKPKGMHWRTFQRIQHEITRLEWGEPPAFTHS